MERSEELFEKITGRTTILIGDVFLNETIQGDMERWTNENPIPVVQMLHNNYLPGAAAYAAVLLRQLGLQVKLVTVTGDDFAGRQLLQILADHAIDTSGVIVDAEYITSQRSTINVAGIRYAEREIMRLQTPEPLPLSEEKFEKIMDYLEENIPDTDAIIFIDKDESVVSRKLVEAVQKTAQKYSIKLIGDSEKNCVFFNNFTAVTPNVHEAQAALNGRKDHSSKLGKQLRSLLKCDTVFMTLGGEGISVINEARDVCHVAAKPRLVGDTDGAGEAVVAGVTAGLLAGLPPEQTADLANTMAALAVSRKGFTCITRKEIIEAQLRYALEMNVEKHVTIEQLQSLVARARLDGKKIVWTNGCYDILHAGHVIYLEKAKALGDVLVVGLNSDASVRKNKGPLRPVVEENQRARVLSALSCVDYVIIFDDESPLAMIDALRPDVYVKGGDYNIETINQGERRLVESYGGEIALLPGVEGMSTSEVIRRILEAYSK
ncbi:MAG TPA: D-glycero-beta-D-manno-heptose 1-phosphate adenylyltransferase [bacterium]|nr:D-glycero-beta-D-manno-heptose 1-phosphate adenylyltransferase [bacterium]HPN45435.1 D-glycero-beta-D-manno-heptose 1-phosphate adenylyltransferase [bacterium]